MALTYELEVEFNGGDWRLRKYPGQKHINGKPPSNSNSTEDASKPTSSDTASVKETENSDPKSAENEVLEGEATQHSNNKEAHPNTEENKEQEDNEEDDEDDGWITPSNIRKKKAEDGVGESLVQPKHLKVACATTDFSMQNVLLQIGLNLVSSDGFKIQNVKRFVLRCHGCYTVVKDMEKKFCPSCGGNTLIKTTCSINSKGEFQVHLKKNFEWKTRGTKYSLPKPVHGTSNGKGKKNPVLREDQPEYQRAVRRMQRKKEIDLMDEDYLPSLLTGVTKDRMYVQIGAGRKNPNEVRRKKR